MRKKEELIKQKVDETLAILDDIRRVPGNPYLSTRIEQQLENEANSVKAFHYEKALIGLKSAFLVMTVMTLLNGFVVWNTLTESNVATQEELFDESLGNDSNYLNSFF